jgi:hypothetical protein
VKTIQQPKPQNECHFALAQEALHNNIERAFSVLQAWFAIVRGPTSFGQKIPAKYHAGVRNRQVVFPEGQMPQHIVTCTGENMQETP